MEWIKTSEQLPEFTRADTNWQASDWVIVWDKYKNKPDCAYLAKTDESGLYWIDTFAEAMFDYFKYWMPITPPLEEKQ